MFSSRISKSQEIWKILIYDDFCRDIIVPLFNVNDLRKEGITLHMLIDSEREKISEAPAIYFVQPTEKNINRICEDAKNSLYKSFCLNFSSSISKTLLEKFARLSVENDGFKNIFRVVDQYVDFISLEDNLFDFVQKNSYVAFHDPKIPDAIGEESVEKTVNSLFSVITTLGSVPIIRSPSGDSASIISQALDSKIRDHLSKPDNLLMNSTWNRPLLLILDRNVDLSVGLSHGWTYQALMHDLLNYKLNRVSWSTKKDDNDKKTLNTSSQESYYNLDSNDTWWIDHSSLPFPQVCNDIYEGIENLSKKKASMNEDGFSAKSMSSLVEILPEMQERRKTLEVHTEIATAINDIIRYRSLDQFINFEESIMIKVTPNHILQLENLLQIADASQEDKLRAFLIYFLVRRKKMDRDEMDEINSLLKKYNLPQQALKYIEKIHAFNESWASISQQNSHGIIQSNKGFAKDLTQMFSAITSYILPGNKDFIVTQILDAAMELKDFHGVDNYLYFDPKFPVNSMPRKNTPFKEAIVFIVGGGNYLEMHNIMDYFKRLAPSNSGVVPKKVIYGTTEMVLPNMFLNQLSSMLNEI